MARTLLAVLVRQRQLTQDEMIEVLRHRARVMDIPDNRFDVSVRQLQRWIAGHVRRPHPVQCRVLEAEFGHRVEELLAASGPGAAAGHHIQASRRALGGGSSRTSHRRMPPTRPAISRFKISQRG